MRPPRRPRQERAYWTPPLVLASLILMGPVLAAFGGSVGGMGFAALLAAPAAVGVVVGYGVRARWPMLGLLLLVPLAAVGTLLAMQELMGLLCGAFWAMFYVGPAIAGLGVGVFMRFVLKDTHFSQRHYLPVLLVGAVLTGAAAAEARLLPAAEHESVTTSRVLEIDSDRVWRTPVFRGGPTSDAEPLLCSLGLPAPSASEGRLRRAGDRNVIELGKARVVLRVTRVVPGRELAFAVEEQTGFEDRAVRLLGGHMVLEPLGRGRTRVGLTTTYEPLLRARPLWRGCERFVADSLQGYVLDEISRTSRGQFQRRGSVSPAPRETSSVAAPDSKRSPFQR